MSDRRRTSPKHRRGGRRRVRKPALHVAAVAGVAALVVAPSLPEAPARVGPCASNVLPDPLPDYPGPGTTGVPDGTELTTIHGDYHTAVYGQVIDRLNITGQLFVDHDNVKVKCSRIRGMTTNKGKDLKIWLSTLGDAQGVGHGSALKWSDYVLRRVDVRGTIDGLKAEGDVDVQDSYIHDLFRTEDPSQPNGMTHNDAVQIGEGSGMVFKHNTILAWSFEEGEAAGAHLYETPFGDGEGYTTSAFLVSPAQGPISDVLIQDNVIRGRASKYVHVIGSARDVRILDNRMGRESRDYPDLFAVNDATLVEGNTFLDGGDANR